MGKKTPGLAGRLPFPYLKVSGSAYDCGRALGERFAHHIRTGLERRAEWFAELRGFMQQDLKGRNEGFLAAAERHFPEVVEELRGWAAGSGVALQDLVALNIKAELGAMRKKLTTAPGCSTLALAHRDRLLLAHNEDGDAAYADLMFIVEQHQPGKPAFVSLTYPGILPGNAPAINEAGLVLTTNYIASSDWRVGVGRYFLDRAMLNAQSLDEAVRIAGHRKRAFAFHYNLASVRERRILSVETSVDRVKTYEVPDLYVHTNHLVLEGMRDVAQDAEYVRRSSASRYAVLSAWRKEAAGRIDALDGTDLVAALSSHQGAPYSPCRHPTDEVRGATLACSLFDLTTGSWTLYAGNPCQAEPVRWIPFAKPTLSTQRS